MAKLTTEDFIRKARIRHGERYDYSNTVYTGAHSKLKIVCPRHGEFEQLAGDHANVGKGCYECGKERSTPAAFTTAQFTTEARRQHGDFYDYSKVDYVTYKLPVVLICPLHGEFSQRAGLHLRGNGCPVCRNGNKVVKYRTLTTDQRRDAWVDKVTRAHAGRYDYSRVEFKNSQTPVEIACKEHGVFYQTPSNHLHGKCRCPGCGAAAKADKNRRSHSSWLAEFDTSHGVGVYDYSGVAPITAAAQRVSIGCRAHGSFQQQVYVHAAGHGCPKCSKNISDPEVELREWLIDQLPDGVELLHGKRDVISPYELDIYIPELRLAVEFNGTFWHCDDKKEKLYHQKKSLMCRKLGILLVHIYEFDWTLRKDACKRLLRGKLGTQERKVSARSLAVKSAAADGEFLDANHFQGKVPSSVRYGLFEGDVMVALMTFGRPRFAHGHTWELLRFCSMAGLRVRGGAGKLFARFKRDHLLPGDTVISYARMDYSNGGVYVAMGFSGGDVCAPDYTWVKQPNIILRRQSTQKHKLPKLLGNKFDATKSESENMKGAGYKRIYSAGNLRYVYAHE